MLQVLLCFAYDVCLPLGARWTTLATMLCNAGLVRLRWISAVLRSVVTVNMVVLLARCVRQELLLERRRLVLATVNLLTITVP